MVYRPWALAPTEMLQLRDVGIRVFEGLPRFADDPAANRCRLALSVGGWGSQKR